MQAPKVTHNNALYKLKKLKTVTLLQTFLIGSIYTIGFSNNVFADSATNNNESAVNRFPLDETMSNNIGQIFEQQEIETLKKSYISPYNYTQDPIAYNMGVTAKAQPNGTYHVGLSSVLTENIIFSTSNSAANNNTGELWGQSDRWNGFAVGGTMLLGEVISQIGQPNTFTSTGVVTASQAYLDYKYSNIVQVTAGNILLTTPWVNSFGSFPGATYANQNNTFQGATANLQVVKNLLLTGFYIYNYLQYPNLWFSQSNLYNTFGGPLANIGSRTNPGAAGAGAIWYPATNYTLNLWFYQFRDYANMWYFDNKYTLPLSADLSMDFAFQALNQSSDSNSITTYTALPGQTSAAGVVSSNAIGLKWAINLPYDSLSLSYNQIFGANGSFQNGGMLSPYTYGLETDPLYTTPALISLVEQGSGNSYSIKNTVQLFNSNFKFHASYSQFFINKVWQGQASAPITEYDAGVLYNIPNSNFNVWSRLVYVDNPSMYGSLWQPRIIVNYTF